MVGAGIDGTVRYAARWHTGGERAVNPAVRGPRLPAARVVLRTACARPGWRGCAAPAGRTPLEGRTDIVCGIAGYYGTRMLGREPIERCLGLMSRRGPDQQAARSWQRPDGRSLTLLFSRLSIIDLDERANQPFNVGSQWLVFNGELYNYVELARELPAGTLRTRSDTEVLLRTLDARGWPALDAFEGMWAFAVFDERTGTLGLSRDRFGEKPLYLYRDVTGLYFGSEIKFIAELAGRFPPVDLDQVRRYLVNGYKSLYKSGRTFFEGVTELEPGTLLEIH